MVRYVGTHFQSTHRHMFAHYTAKRDSAITAAGGIVGCELIIGRNRLDPTISLQLYSALVDCHLIHGCELIIDTDTFLLSMLEQVQLLCLRRLLGLSRRSMVAPLFTETGVMPIRFRRVILALRYLIYLLKLPLDHYANLAPQANHVLRSSGNSWLSDLDWAIQHLPNSTLVLPPLTQLSEQTVLSLIKAISQHCNQFLQSEIDNSNRLALLQRRREPCATTPSKYQARTLRHYLTRVLSPNHRLTLTRLLCGDMVLLTFWSSRTRPLQPADCPTKQCRACKSPGQPESPQHVLLQCTSVPGLSIVREQFLTDMTSLVTLPNSRIFSNSKALYYLKAFVFGWESVRPTARFINDAIILWKQFLTQDLDVEEEDGPSDEEL
ncbi:hypothetical protein EV368DRAFT_40960 [Lentinula lateritia]|nr:hypothetical protein EV368DRAFT_40960 [Lentinula lateritia]